MDITFALIFNSIMLGVGLAMDAFSVSVANGLNEPNLKGGKVTLIAGIFAVFQALMPMLGWVLVHTLLGFFSSFEKVIPYLSLALLGFIGGKMIYDTVKSPSDCTECKKLTFLILLGQAVATSIDALSVGFTIASYGVFEAIVSSVIIAIVTFIICLAGVVIGKHFGEKFSGKAGIFGGIILIVIGLEIFISSFF